MMKSASAVTAPPDTATVAGKTTWFVRPAIVSVPVTRCVAPFVPAVSAAASGSNAVAGLRHS